MVTSIESRLEPVYVRDVQRLLASGVMPGDRLDHEESWLPFGSVIVEPASPDATASHSPGDPFVLRFAELDRLRRRGQQEEPPEGG
jgi:hypothetical protein